MTDSTRTDATTTGDATSGGRPLIRALASGVPGLDTVLGGGLPESSFNVIAGAPGTGKTTLALQILFANASAERPALYFTMLGESVIKLLRYQQHFTFFRPELVGSTVHVRSVSADMLNGEFVAVLARITADVERFQPSVVIVDSFVSIDAGGAGHFGAGRFSSSISSSSSELGRPGAMGLEEFIQRLALQLTTWEVTSFLLGVYAEAHLRYPMFTVADGVLWLTQATDRNSVVRKLQVTKVRGRAHLPGLHTFRMTDAGVQIFPRIPEQQRDRTPGRPRGAMRLPTGVPGLDALMGGGIPAGDAMMIAGPTGAGKTTIGMQFVADGLRRGEPCVVAVFEEYPEDYLARMVTLGVDTDAAVRAGLLTVSYLRPLDLSVDETLAEILEAVRQHGATRVVLDSLSGFEVALAPTFREDFRESLYRLVGALTAAAVTVLMTHEAVGALPDVGFTGARVSFITDDIVVLRYVEIAGALRKVLAVVKMRRSQHSDEFWTYNITPAGAVVGEPLTGYHGIQTGIPDRRREAAWPAPAGLTDRETGVLDALTRLGQGTPDAVAAQLAAPGDAVVRAFARLVALGYVVPLDSPGDGGGREHRPVVLAAERPREHPAEP
ncbi:MAG: ATPase domain-containing protein [Gemmatimonadaceae bacterium]